MAEVEVLLLGSPQVRCGGWPVAFRTRKALALLAYLALEPGWQSCSGPRPARATDAAPCARA
ncbi:hypothetical protein MHY01S_05490 [Meiothermus hypogaeus NBRC 106114]|uniref:Uncharacterized protein n=2 Tax=Meiothermus hypogaeus TaxID=884155 RepID=A0A511QYB5_9DEIN|nr:hypothetical protein Mhypo_00578 [Meiothermus hypogaeus]GEM82383.1 hypothetical protein MHY01S_05490 [Meiothermus hypogaeus NBRC 106114]